MRWCWPVTAFLVAVGACKALSRGEAGLALFLTLAAVTLSALMTSEGGRR